MKVAGSRAYTRPTPVPKMPLGLMELMEGMTKEVLKHNPTNVYEFCAAHMERLLETRDGSSEKHTLTLDEKIIKAQKIVKLRAQKRQQNYDKQIQLLCDKDDQTALLKDPVSHEIILNNVGEIEISQKTISNLDCSENNERNFEVPLASIFGDQINDIVREPKNSEVLFEREPPLDQNCAVSHQEIIDKLNCNNASEIKENSKICADMLITNVLVNSSEIGELKETESGVVDEERKNDERIEITPVIDQAMEQTTNTFRNEANNIDAIDNKEQDRQTESKQKNDVNTKTNDVLNNDSGSNNDVNCSNEDLENENLVSDHYKINYSENISISSAPGATPLPIENHLENSSLDKITNLRDFTKEKVDKISEDLEKNGDAVLLPSSKESVPQSNSYDNKEVINVHHQHTKGDKESGISRTLDKGVESSFNNISNDNRTTNNMDLETAAITIQKVFRSFLFKSKASTDEANSIDEDHKETNDYTCPNIIKDRRSLGITRMDTVLQTVNEEKSLSLSTDDSSTLSSAATIIQAHIRGFLIRNKLNKTASTNSLLNSEDRVTTSTENDNQNQCNNKTVLNIHIVPEGEVPLSRDESIVTSMDLSLDGSPPSSINLHPLGYDKSEPRKQLKREDAVQSISPPSNNSGKLSEDIDSTKEMLLNDVTSDHNSSGGPTSQTDNANNIPIISNTVLVENNPDNSSKNNVKDNIAESKIDAKPTRNPLTKMNSDEMDVVTPFPQDETPHLPESSNNSTLLHSGELHDVVLPTNVSRSSTSVVRGE